MLQAVIDIVNGYDPLCSFQPAEFLGQESDWAAAEHDDRISIFYAGIIYAPECRGHGISDQA
ncbi:hypothetical protein D3C74_438710 [compost metagenome]